MKQKRLIIATALFFLLFNTSYFWEGKLGTWALLEFLIFVIVFISLIIALLQQIYLSVKEKFSNKKRTFSMVLLTIVLSLAYIFPQGIIDFDKFNGKDILVAEREGSANCMTTFKLKEDGRFIEKNICFGVTEVSGNYKIKNDTIYFENSKLNRYDEAFFEFAIIKPSLLDPGQNKFDLIKFKNKKDTIGYELWVIKNELNKQATSKRE